MLHDTAHENERDDTVGLIGQFGRFLARRRQRRRAIAELEAMDDMLLRDMGIYRSDIRRVVNGFGDRDLGLPPSPRASRKGERRGPAPNKRNRVAIAA
ncbi:DUF1127 domain-containing protein [Roseovarius spongiae]|uniref:DUF1127 domain-containing protein n=2 Tax=Roseovarius spongiae TaxID=2320272 RepID=A0A3A8B8F1_9RHOB|nr:DUF1127 domain-containing protein [Roseovarius spongiae]